jgi:hypothetical protein
MKEAFKVIGNYLAVDGNRDGSLTFDFADRKTSEHPWRWWINDDKDQENVDIDSGADVPGSGSNGTDGAVNGRRDLVDVFPVGIDLSGLRQAFPPSDGYAIQLRQADGAVNVVPVNHVVGSAFDYLTHEQDSGYGGGFGQAAHNANVTAITSAGVPIPTEIDQLWRSSNASAVMLVEGRSATKKPLELVINRGNFSVVAGQIELSMSPVEDMYRWLNLRGVVQAGGKSTRTEEPENLPDSECSDAQVVWVHGFNVGPEPARAWMAELYKRLYQTRMKASFTGVTWAGDLGNGLIIEYLTADYHLSVVNGAKTAPALAQAVAALSGPSRKILVSHSMGAGVVGPAIADFGLSGYDKYFAIDAAMAMEAYDAGMPDATNMIHPAWRDATGRTYPNKLVASRWNELWPDGDDRRKLTWRGRLGLLPRMYNVYSTGEEVLANSTGQAPNILPTWLGGNGPSPWAWQVQEWTKGGNALVGIPNITFVHNAHGGWGFNVKQMVSLNSNYDDPFFVSPNQRRPVKINEANLTTPVTGADLFNIGSEYIFPIGDRVAERLNDLTTNSAQKSRPLFKPFDIQAQLSGLGGAGIASTERVRLLAEVIPAVTYAMGANPLQRSNEASPQVPGYDMNINVEVGWPSVAQYPDHQQWFHSDIKDVAYLYTWRVFDYIVNTGNLR